MVPSNSLLLPYGRARTKLSDVYNHNRISLVCPECAFVTYITLAMHLIHKFTFCHRHMVWQWPTPGERTQKVPSQHYVSKNPPSQECQCEKRNMVQAGHSPVRLRSPASTTVTVTQYCACISSTSTKLMPSLWQPGKNFTVRLLHFLKPVFHRWACKVVASVYLPGVVLMVKFWEKLTRFTVRLRVSHNYQVVRRDPGKGPRGNCISYFSRLGYLPVMLFLLSQIYYSGVFYI